MSAGAARWIVPAAVTALVVGGGVAASASGDAVPDLPERTAAELLVALGEAEPTPFSGTVRTVADLGLPSLDDLGALTGEDVGTGTDPLAILNRLATGENSLRVWVGGPEQQRVSLLDDLAEVDLVRDGDVAWTYSSAEKTAVRYDLAALAERAAAEHASGDEAVGTEPEANEVPQDLATVDDMTPDELARTLLAEADETTEVMVGEAQVVAGRDAYTLVATPRDDATLVGGIEVAVDAATGLVLQVQVDARGQEDPAFVTGFTALDLQAPDAEVFAFTPPAGTTVLDGLEELEAKASDDAEGQQPDLGALEEMLGDEELPEPVVHGEGWSTVVELALPDAPASDGSQTDGGQTDGRPSEDAEAADQDEPAGDAAEALGGLTTEVEGGTVFSTALLTVLVTDDGRVLLGSVDAETLQSYAG